MSNLMMDDESVAKRVIGAAIEVHRALGPGFLESVYEEALSIEFHVREVAFERQYVIPIHYRDQLVGQGRLDFLVEGCVIVELKAVDELSTVHTAQVISYLKATDLRLGLLLNFNVPLLRQGLKRIVL